MPKPKWKVGDTGYEVEWCHFRYVDPEDGCTGDPDLDKHRVALFRSHESAIAYAKKIYPEDQYGAVRLTPVEIVPQYEEHPNGPTMLDYTGDTEYYEGEDS